MAIEIANIFHAAGTLRGDTTPPTFLAQLGFVGAVTRLAAGVYRATLEQPADFGELVCVAQTPAPAQASAQVISDSVIEVRCTVDGVGFDASQIGILLLRYRLGAVAIPPAPPLPGGAGLPVALVGYGAGVAFQDFYVRTTGADTNAGTIAAPFLTLQRAVEEAERTQGAVRVHIGAGTYAAPILRNLLGPVAFIGDGGGVGDGMTVLQAPAAAGALTSAALIAGVFGAGAFDRKTIEILSGAAAGYRRTIVQTQVGGLVPLRAFVDAVPAVGDSYRIVESAIIIEGFPSGLPWIQNCGPVEHMVHDSIFSLGAPAGPAQMSQGIYFVNCMFDGGFGLTPSVIGSTVLLAGVEGVNTFRWDLRGSYVFSGSDDPAPAGGRFNNLVPLLGLPGADDFAGFGSAFDSPPGGVAYLIAGGGAWGYFMQPSQILQALGGAVVEIIGGRFATIVAQDGSQIYVSRTDAPQMIISGTGNGAIAVEGGRIDFQDATIIVEGTIDGIRVQQGGEVFCNPGMTVTGTADVALDCSQGGRAYLRGAPGINWTGGVNGFRVSAAEVAASAFFAALDATLVAAVGNGSLITRVA